MPDMQDMLWSLLIMFRGTPSFELFGVVSCGEGLIFWMLVMTKFWLWHNMYPKTLFPPVFSHINIAGT